MSLSPSNTSNFPGDESAWSLVGRIDGTQSQTIQLRTFPFQVGRRDGLGLTLRSNTISKSHAEFVVERGVLYLCDLNSTNGTFLNGIRIKDRVALKGNDLIQFERIEFQLCERTLNESKATQCFDGVIATSFELRRILAQRAIVPHYQPIVRLSDGEIIGYEVLVRSTTDGLLSARELFDSAERAGLECELSELSRYEGVRQAAAFAKQPALFLNTHPAELSRPELIPSLQRLRRKNPKASLVLEIHESSVCDYEMMRTLTQTLRELNIGLAYDDFGHGQSRLVELMDLPPEYLKFDMQLIRGIDTAPLSRRKTVESLVQMTTELGASPLAEGIETPGEALVCADLGFALAQGYLCGMPISARAVLTKQVQVDFGIQTSMSRQRPSDSRVPELVSG